MFVSLTIIANRIKHKSTKKFSGEAATTLPDCHGADLPPDLDKLRSVLIANLTSTLTSTLKRTIDEVLKPLSATLEEIKSTIESHTQKLADMDTALSDHSGRTVALEDICSCLQSDNTQLRPRRRIWNRVLGATICMVGIWRKRKGQTQSRSWLTFSRRSWALTFSPLPRPSTERTALARLVLRVETPMPGQGCSLSDFTIFVKKSMF